MYICFQPFLKWMCWLFFFIIFSIARAIFLFQLSHFKSAFNVICLYPFYLLYLTNVPLKECVRHLPPIWNERRKTLIIHPFHLICWMWPSHLLISYLSSGRAKNVDTHNLLLIIIIITFLKTIIIGVKDVVEFIPCFQSLNHHNEFLKKCYLNGGVYNVFWKTRFSSQKMTRGKKYKFIMCWIWKEFRLRDHLMYFLLRDLILFHVLVKHNN